MPSRLRYRFFLPALLLALAAIPAAADPAAEYRKAIQTLRCDCSCHPQSIESCACGRADELRETIAAMTYGDAGRDGLTAQGVIALYVAEHGEQIRIAPAAAGFNLLAWLGPLIALVLGLLATVALVRHLARSAGTEPEVLSATGTPETRAVDLDDPYREKLRRQIEEWD